MTSLQTFVHIDSTDGRNAGVSDLEQIQAAYSLQTKFVTRVTLKWIDNKYSDQNHFRYGLAGHKMYDEYQFETNPSGYRWLQSLYSTTAKIIWNRVLI